MLHTTLRYYEYNDDNHLLTGSGKNVHRKHLKTLKKDRI